MALGFDYLKFNSEVLPWAKKNSVKLSHVETVSKTEAGTDVGIVTRLNQPTFSYSFTVTSMGLDKLLTIGSYTQGTLYINNDAGHIVRPRVQSYNLVQNSELTEGTDGLYDVTMTFYEK